MVELLVLIAIAALGVAVADRLRLPSIVGFLAIGALVGPHGIGLVDDPDRVSVLAELGVVILLFEIGLELPVDRIRSFLREALVAGGLQVGLTLTFGWGIAMAFGVPWQGSLVIGAVVAMSSTALVMGILSDRGEIDAPHGRLATGVLLFQDLCIVPFLLAVPLLAASSGETGLATVLRAIAGAGLALALLFAGARIGLPRLLDQAARTRSRELFGLLALLVVLGAAVAADALGLTLAVGAFIAGLALSASPYSHQLFAELMPLRGVLLGVFFTAVGMLVDAPAAVLEPTGVLLYAVGVIGLKALLVAFVVAVVLRQGVRRAMLCGLALAQTGEFSFVLAGTAVAAGLLTPSLHQTFLAGSMLTLLATPFLIQAAPGIATRVGRLSRERVPDEPPAAASLRDHVVLIGFGIAGQNVARVLRSRDIPYLGVETNAQNVRSARARSEPVLYGDATRRVLVERLGVDRARLVVVAISDPSATKEVVALVRSLCPTVPIIARTRYVEDIDALESAGATVVTEEYEVTLELVAETLRRFDVPEELIARFSAGLREEGYELLRGPTAMIIDPWLTEMLEEDGSAWIEVPETFEAGPSLAELDLRARTGVNVVAVEREGEQLLNPPPSYGLRRGDRLLVLGSPDALGRLRRVLTMH